MRLAIERALAEIKWLANQASARVTCASMPLETLSIRDIGVTRTKCAITET